MSDIYERVHEAEQRIIGLESQVAVLERQSLRKSVLEVRAQLGDIEADAKNLRATLDALSQRVADSLPTLDQALADVSRLIREALDDGEDLGALSGLDTEPPPPPDVDSPDNQPAPTDPVEGPDAS